MTNFLLLLIAIYAEAVYQSGDVFTRRRALNRAFNVAADKASTRLDVELCKQLYALRHEWTAHEREK